VLTQTQQELLKQQVLNCPNKDSSGLNDFQKLPDSHAVMIPYVGISRFRIPMTFQHDFGHMSHDVEASMSVQLNQGKTGINMSRLCQVLQDCSTKEFVSSGMLQNFLIRLTDELRDSSKEKLLENATIKLKFKYPVKQKSLKSSNWGWQYYDAAISGELNKDGEYKISLSLDYEYSSTCPCSLSMAKQYEAEYEQGLTDEGNGIGVAHGQRSRARVLAILSPSGLSSHFFLEDLLQVLRMAIPTETQSLVKRIDEQAFAILNGSNPMFVEHVAKKLWFALNDCTFLEDWIAQIEHFESLHSHNAAAVIHKGKINGLNKTDLFS